MEESEFISKLICELGSSIIISMNLERGITNNQKSFKYQRLTLVREVLER
jgi:hypothetical protein